MNALSNLGHVCRCETGKMSRGKYADSSRTAGIVTELHVPDSGTLTVTLWGILNGEMMC